MTVQKHRSDNQGKGYASASRNPGPAVNKQGFTRHSVGELTIEVDLPMPDGGRKPLTVLRWKPRLALGLITPVPRHLGNVGGPTREECARLAEACAELAEIRAINEKPRVLSEGKVRNWLAERKRNFALLRERGLAGGKLWFRITYPKSRTAAVA